MNRSQRDPFSMEPTARSLYFILIRPKRWHFCDKIKLADSCRWKYKYSQGEKHLASCVTCKTGINTLSLRINEHPYWIKLCFVQSTDTCAQIYCVKYHFKQFNNKWAILKMCFVNWRFRSFVQYIFTDRSKAVLLLWIKCVFYVLFLSWFRVCSWLPWLPCGHLLGKGWPLGSRLWCVGILVKVWYLIVLIPDLCRLSYFVVKHGPNSLKCKVYINYVSV